MHVGKSPFLLFAALWAAACHSPTAAGSPNDVVFDQVQASPRGVYGHEVAVRDAAVLEQVVELDRRAVVLAEQRLAHLREASRAGLLEGAKLVDAELGLIRGSQQLLVREQQWAEAKIGAKATLGDGGASQVLHRRKELLRQLIDLDRQAVQLVGQQLSNLKALHEAGRQDLSAMVAVETELLRCKQVLLLREHELAIAEMDSGR